MSSDADNLAIRVKNVSKSYVISHQGANMSFREALLHRLKNPIQQMEKEEFWALRDLSFDVKRGDVVGVIGRNGAGKSTLLKLLSRITEPTEGEIHLRGRVGSLLEVGTGFHPELTGRENIYLNGSILGMTRREIAAAFDAIVDFSGTEKFLDTPVKRYSSGMYVRLAFAVAAHLNPEILIVDEVLAVGDIEFQKKCLGKMQDVANSGRTVLFVSHNMQSISLLCNTGICLRAGGLVFAGDTETCIQEYLRVYSAANNTGQEIQAAERRPGSGEFRYVSVEPVQTVYTEPAAKRFKFVIERKKPGGATRFFLQARVVNAAGLELIMCDSRLTGVWLDACDRVEGEFVFTHPWLLEGEYHLEAYIFTTAQNIDTFYDACAFEISPVLPYAFMASDAIHPSFCKVLSDYRWDIEKVLV